MEFGMRISFVRWQLPLKIHHNSTKFAPCWSYWSGKKIPYSTLHGTQEISNTHEARSFQMWGVWKQVGQDLEPRGFPMTRISPGTLSSCRELMQQHRAFEDKMREKVVRCWWIDLAQLPAQENMANALKQHYLANQMQQLDIANRKRHKPNGGRKG